ncbi:MAG: hypothetical protein LBI13_04625 [Streptococcaceae bacterium]|jgi:hypothetical protein|nr:hypothetical protein [Streptococcaceae bacterium]
MNSVKIEGKSLIDAGKPIATFQENILKMEVNSQNEIIVLINFAKGTKLTSEQLLNLYKYDISGNQSWGVSYTNLKKIAPIVDFKITENRLLASDFYGRAFEIDMKTGVASMIGVTK